MTSDAQQSLDDERLARKTLRDVMTYGLPYERVHAAAAMLSHLREKMS